MQNQARNAPLDRKRRNKTARTRTRILAFCTILAALSVPALAVAQDINEAVTIEDLGFTHRLRGGARAIGFAGAYTAIDDDVDALIYNPAGLAGIRRVDISLAFQHRSQNLKNSFYGTPNDLDLSVTKLDNIAFAYPVPTYRGSLVLAAGAYRAYSSYIDILNRGVNLDTSTDDDYRLQQSGSIYSYNFGAAMDLSPTLSVGANLFLLYGEVTALTQFTYQFLPPPVTPGDLSSETLIDDARVDVNGYGAVVGLQYHPNPMVQVGVSVTTPTPVRLRGDAVQDDALYFVNSPDSFFTDLFAIETDYQLPFRIDGGVAWSRDPVVISVDIGYSDWTQATINDVQLKDTDLQAVFRGVFDWRGGIEVAIPNTSIRLRGGYSYEPNPLDHLQGDRITGDQIQQANVDSERQTFAAGFGALLADALQFDVGFEYQHGERSIPTLTDERSVYRFVFGGSYRF